MLTDELDYELPPDLIAQEPIEPRDSARLLLDRGRGSEPLDLRISDFPSLVEPGDVVVVNETKVLPARVAIRRHSGGEGEVLFLSPAPEFGNFKWESLCRPSRKMKPGDMLTAQSGRLEVTAVEDLGDGRWVVEPSVAGLPLDGEQLAAELETCGTMPLPPYIDHGLKDRDRYQTVFARRAASAAAPTAGLHFTPSTLESIASRGASLRRVELVVGLDTFRPITVDRVEDHAIHTEFYRVPEETRDAADNARAGGHKVIAVGTTSVRALESAASNDVLSGQTSLFITPGFDFQVVDQMLTNFHMPRTSLLAMIEAFVGQRWRYLYQCAIERRYRFLSFGDAMLLTRAAISAQSGASDQGVDRADGRR